MLRKKDPIGNIKDIVHDKTVPNQRVLCVTPSISEVNTLTGLLNCRVTNTPLITNGACAVVLHGAGRPARRALAASTGFEIPVLYTDFGPIKTFDSKEAHALSMTFEHLGPPNAADRETYLEGLIKDDISDAEIARSERVITLWKQAKVSRFNHSLGPELPSQRFVVVLAEPRVLGANPKESRTATAAQVKLAKEKFPTHAVLVVKAEQYAADAIQQADAVFTHSSPVGFEALLWGTPLYVHGMPFYAGWGLTDDSLPAPERRATLPHGLAQLAYAYMVKYSRYANPFDNTRIEVEQAIEFVEKTRPQAIEDAKRRENLRRKLPTWLHGLVKG